MTDDTKVKPLFSDRSLTNDLHTDLMNAIHVPKYDGMTATEIVGVLEFLKWNFINLAEGNRHD